MLEEIITNLNKIVNELKDIEYQLIRNNREMGKYLTDRHDEFVKKKMRMAIYSAIAAQIGRLSVEIGEIRRQLQSLSKEDKDE